MSIIHELNKDDTGTKMQFCKLMSESLISNVNCIKSICFSDERNYFLNENVNRQHIPRYFLRSHSNSRGNKCTSLFKPVNDLFMCKIYFNEVLKKCYYLTLIYCKIY